MKQHLALTMAGMFLLSPAVYAQGGYFGLGIGTATYSEADFDESDTGLNIYGGLRASENLGFELSYSDFGKPEGNYFGYNASVEVTGLGFSVVGFLPVSNNFDLFGKVGLMAWDADVTLGPVSASDDGSDLLFGFGATYHFNDQFALRGAWEFVDLDEGELDMLSINAQINF